MPSSVNIDPATAAATASAALQAQANPLANGATAPRTLEQAQAVGKEFESFFLSQMLAHMFEGLGNDPLFGGGHGEAVYRSMMVQEYGTVLSQNGGVGIADSVTREMLRIQEESQ